MLILTNRSWSRIILATLRIPNPALWWVISGAFGVLVLVISVPLLQSLLSFGPLNLFDVTVCMVGEVTSLLWFEVWKIMRNKVAAIRAS